MANKSFKRWASSSARCISLSINYQITKSSQTETFHLGLATRLFHRDKLAYFSGRLEGLFLLRWHLTSPSSLCIWKKILLKRQWKCIALFKWHGLYISVHQQLCYRKQRRIRYPWSTKGSNITDFFYLLLPESPILEDLSWRSGAFWMGGEKKKRKENIPIRNNLTSLSHLAFMPQ